MGSSRTIFMERPYSLIRVGYGWKGAFFVRGESKFPGKLVSSVRRGSRWRRIIRRWRNGGNGGGEKKKKAKNIMHVLWRDEANEPYSASGRIGRHSRWEVGLERWIARFLSICYSSLHPILFSHWKSLSPINLCLRRYREWRISCYKAAVFLFFV